LQEIDHVPFVAPLTRFAATAESADAVGGLIDDALAAAVGAPSGVSFVDFPMDHVFSEANDASGPGVLACPPAPVQPDADSLDAATRLLAKRSGPSSWQAPMCGGGTPRPRCATLLRRCAFRC